jgi:hypothetical protein
MRRINTLDELKAERKRLQAYSLELENELRYEFRLLKKDLRPINLLFGGTRKELAEDQNGLISVGAGSLAGFLTKSILMKRSGFLAKLIVPAVVGKITSGLVERNKGKIIELFRFMVSKITIKREVNTNNEDKRTDEFLS